MEGHMSGWAVAGGVAVAMEDEWVKNGRGDWTGGWKDEWVVLRMKG